MSSQRLSGRISYLTICIVVTAPIWLLPSCHPKIYDFTASPRSIGPNDKLQVNWRVKGAPTLLINDKALPGPDTAARLRELTLVVKKNGQETSELIQVAVLPNGFTDKIVFRTALKGDTLVAAGLNSSIRWGDAFVIQTVSSGSNRPITILHEGRTLQLDPSSNQATSFQGTAIKGQWEFRTLLTPAEKANLTLAPDHLEILITVQHH